MRDLSRAKASREFFEKSFMMRLTAPCDAISMCVNIRDLLVRVNGVFAFTSVTRADYELLQETVNCTEQMFSGINREDFFDLFYNLGVVLLRLGEEDLGVTCQYLHHTYQNRSRNSWPPLAAHTKGHSASLKKLLPIINARSISWDAETVIDLETLPR